MKRNLLKRVISAAVSAQMMCAVIPCLSSTVCAADLLMYLDEDCTAITNKWTGKTENMQAQSDEEIP